jgi:hypothetical protein
MESRVAPVAVAPPLGERKSVALTAENVPPLSALATRSRTMPLPLTRQRTTTPSKPGDTMRSASPVCRLVQPVGVPQEITLKLGFVRSLPIVIAAQLEPGRDSARQAARPAMRVTTRA